MNTVWTIIKKDFRHCRWLLLAMATVWLVKAYLMVQAATPPGPGRTLQPVFFQPVPMNGPNLYTMIFNKMQLSLLPAAALFPIFAVYFVDIYLLMGITLRVLREDSAVMELSFWRTRPISRRQMLAAKAIFIGLIAFPVQCLIQGATSQLILDRGDIHYFSTPIPALWWGSERDMLLIQAGWTAAAVLVATLWRSRVAGAGALILSVMAVVFTDKAAQSVTGYRQSETINFLLLYTGLAGMVLIAAYMYLKANRALGFSLYGALLAAILIISLCQ